MKKKLLVVSLLIVFILSVNKSLFAQDSLGCKVLLESISGKYEGKCKNGLAHGSGKAEGKDKYKGRFKFGLPHGGGVYYFSNGDYYNGNFVEGKKDGKGEFFSALNNKKIKGIWKEDKLDREITDPAYEIIQNYNLTSISIMEKSSGAPNSVEFVFSRDGRISNDLSSLTLISSTGNLVRNSNYSGLEYVQYPTEIYINFSAPNRFNTLMVRYEVKLKINKPGKWKVLLRY